MITVDAGRTKLGQEFVDAMEAGGVVVLDEAGLSHEDKGKAVHGKWFEEIFVKVMDDMQPTNSEEWSV